MSVLYKTAPKSCTVAELLRLKSGAEKLKSDYRFFSAAAAAAVVVVVVMVAFENFLFLHFISN